MLYFLANHLRLAIGLSIVLAVAISEGQERDPLKPLRIYPPGVVGDNEIKAALTSIQWQLKQEKAIQLIYETHRDEMASKQESYKNKIDDLNRSLSPTFRFLDAEGRSAMASRAVEQLLNSRLEMTSLQARVQALQTKLANEKETPANELQALKLDGEKKAALLRLRLAESDMKKTQQLATSGSVSSHSVKRAELASAIAQSEYELARKRVEFSDDSAEIAKQLSEARIDIAPIQAKIKTLEELLQTLSETADTLEKINQLKRALELRRTDLTNVEEVLFESTRKAIRLETFRTVIESERKKTDADNQDEKK